MAAGPLVDHLVFAVPDVSAGVAEMEARLGVPFSPGGSHPGAGTRNALLRLGDGVYLEVVGPDPEQPAPPDGLWLADGGPALPALVTWASRSSDLGALTQGPGGHLLGPVRSMSRQNEDGSVLSWTLTMPVRPLPRGGVVPFFIDWGESVHPSAALPHRGLRLAGLRGRHPAPGAVTDELAALGVEMRIDPGEPGLEAALERADGRRIVL